MGARGEGGQHPRPVKSFTRTDCRPAQKAGRSISGPVQLGSSLALCYSVASYASAPRLCMRLKTLVALVFLTLAAVSAAWAQTAPISVVAAENVYGNIAEQLGGEGVKVTSLISNPAQDPHLFEASPATARALSNAQIVIANGADYDAWLDKLLQASPRPDRVVISVATLVGRKPGDNPHLWYDPAAMPAFAKALAAALERADPPHAPDYKSRLGSVLASLKPIDERVASMRGK